MHKTGQLSANSVRVRYPSEEAGVITALVGVIQSVPALSLGSSVLALFTKRLGDRLTLWRDGRKIGEDELAAIQRMNPASDLLDALPALLARDLTGLPLAARSAAPSGSGLRYPRSVLGRRQEPLDQRTAEGRVVPVLSRESRSARGDRHARGRPRVAAVERFTREPNSRRISGAVAGPSPVRGGRADIPPQSWGQGRRAPA